MPFYVDNFLGFPTGTAVPSGTYDTLRGVWEALPNGRVIDVLEPPVGADPRADIDLDGDTQADDDATLLAFGIDDAERTTLATLYPSGASLWRVTLTHFSAVDNNWPTNLPEDAKTPYGQKAPAGPDAVKTHQTPDESCIQKGSIVDCEGAVLGENLPVPGTPFQLHYRSDRVPGRIDASTVDIPVTGELVPASVSEVRLAVEVAGQQRSWSYAPAPGITQRFIWDGRDGFGRLVEGPRPITARISYVYPVTYVAPGWSAERPYFGRSGGELGAAVISAIPAREGAAMAVTQIWRGKVGGWFGAPGDLGGLGITPHHRYRPSTGELFLGDGSKRTATGVVPMIIETIAGSGVKGNAGDEGPATAAQMRDVRGITVAPDGTLYIADWDTGALRSVTPDGIIHHIAGGPGTNGSWIDGADARTARVNGVMGLAVGPEGALYALCAQVDYQLYRITFDTPSPRIYHVAGGGSSQYHDGIRARDASLYFESSSLAVDRDGNAYFGLGAPKRLIARVAPDGVSQQPNSILLWVDGLYDSSDPPLPLAATGQGWRNPCPYDPSAPNQGACVLEAMCVENHDTAAVLNLTIMRDAKQGFFDAGVNFEDIFCSLKVDCSRETAGGEAPINLLHSPADGQRVPTVVLGFACTGGAAADTHLYLTEHLHCGGFAIPLPLSRPPGNVYGNGPPAPSPLIQLATYRGREALTNPDGTPLAKIYFNTALALDFANLPGACNLVATLSAADGPFVPAFTSRAATIYPILRVDVPLVSDANATGYACLRAPLGTQPSDGVWASYTPPDEQVVFDYDAHVEGESGALVVEARSSDLTIDIQTVMCALSASSDNYSLILTAGQKSPSVMRETSDNFTLQSGRLSVLLRDGL